MTSSRSKRIGKADISLAGLSIWIHGRQFEESHDFWDGNWLRATVHVGVGPSQVWASGPIIHLSELLDWADKLRQLYDRTCGEATMKCTEPNLSVNVSLGETGSGEARTEITPDNMTEGHWFVQTIDQSHLPAVIQGIEEVNRKYLLRGKAGR